MNNPSLSDLRLEDILPHRGDMLLVSEIISVDRNHATTLCRTSARWPLAEADGIDPLILTEVAAQTAGVCNGYDRIVARGLDSDKTGWLVGIKRATYAIDRLPLNAEIRARAETTHNFGNLREVYCEQYLLGVCIGNFTLQLFQESYHAHRTG